MKHIIYKQTLLIILLITGVNLSAYSQTTDIEKPLVQVNNEEKDIHWTIGGRLLMDAAYFNSEFTPMKSGATISDTRIRTSLSYKNLFFYADFGFSKNKFSQKNIFLRYDLPKEKGTHSFKGGYFTEPSTMSNNTSQYNYHFMSRPAAVMAFAPDRALGVTYKFFNKHVLLDQGVFAEDEYNSQSAGSQGFSLSGRWVYKPINDENYTLHIGASLRYKEYTGGESIDGVFHTKTTVNSSMETTVDPTNQFLSAEIPWTKNKLVITAEILLRTPKIFLRGEYLYNIIYKQRPDQQLFENQLGDPLSWTTLESWRKGNPLRPTHLSGAYVEAGWLLMGSKYSYNDVYGLLGGCNEKNSLELVIRYSYTNLNDITKGDIYLIGKDKFYPDGVVSDYPPATTSIGGGRMHSATLGLNYTVNQYIKFLVQYQYSNLYNVAYPGDEHFHQVQLRAMFSF